MSEPQPEYVWVFPPEKERNAGRIWLIAGLSLAALAIAAFVVWLLVGSAPAGPDSSPTPTVSSSATPTPSVTPDPSPTSDPSPSASATPPPPSEPSVATFRDQVAPVLDAAATGLRYAREDGGISAMQDVMLLQDDANRLSDRIAPTSIASQWVSALDAYSRSLEALRTAYERGESGMDEDAATVAALAELNQVVGR